jgi:hypothetical protein
MTFWCVEFLEKKKKTFNCKMVAMTKKRTQLFVLSIFHGLVTKEKIEDGINQHIVKQIFVHFTDLCINWQFN